MNHLGHFLLTLELLPLILSSAPDARVVILSSVAHKMANPFDPNNLEGEQDYGRIKQYGSSKLFNVSNMCVFVGGVEGAESLCDVKAMSSIFTV